MDIPTVMDFFSADTYSFQLNPYLDRRDQPLGVSIAQPHGSQRHSRQPPVNQILHQQHQCPQPPGDHLSTDVPLRFLPLRQANLDVPFLEQWEVLKPVIKEFYDTPKLKTSDIIRTMKFLWGFDARLAICP
jgi:hypothetical protein